MGRPVFHAEVRVVALTGGGGAFCSGADLSRRKPGDPPPDSVETTTDLVVRLVRGIRVDCEKPVIAGIDGIVIDLDRNPVPVAGREVLGVSARVRADPYSLDRGSSTIIFTLEAADDPGLRVAEEARFLGPAGTGRR